MKVSYLITVKTNKCVTDYYAVEDYLTDVVEMHGVKWVKCTPLSNRVAKFIRKSLGF